MKFSVLIPAYNVEKYIDECINSVLNQSFDDYEIIIINDGSTDQTYERCRKYKSERIHVIDQNNKGLLLARRAAIKYAKGEYCISLDSDDKLAKNALLIINNLISQYSSDIVIYNLSYFASNKQGLIKEREPVYDKIKLFDEKNIAELYKRLLTTVDLNNLVLKAIKTELLQQDTTDYELIGDNSMGEDLIQSLYPVTYAKRIVYTPQSLYLYRENEKSMTRILDVNNIQSCLKKYNPNVFTLKMQYLELWNLENKEDVRDSIYAGVIKIIINIYKQTYEKLSKEDIPFLAQLEWKKIIPDEVINSLRRLPLSNYEKIQIHEILAGRTLFFKMLKVIK